MTMDPSSISDSSHRLGIPDRSHSMSSSRMNFTPSPDSIVHKRILQTEARIHGQENNGVISSHLFSKPKSPSVSRVKKANNEEENEGQKEGLTVRSSVEQKRSSRHHQNNNTHRRHSDMPQGVPKTISVHDDQEKKGEKTNTYHLDVLKDKKLKSTKAKDQTGTKVQDTSDASVSSSRERLERLGTLLTKARGSCHSVQTRISSLVDDSSVVETQTTEEIQTLLQDGKVPSHRHSYAGTENNTHRYHVSESEHAFSEVARLKARLQMVKKDKTNRTVPSMGHSTNSNVVENWMMDPHPPPPPPSPPVQGRNSEHYMNRLVSKETHYIKTEYQESESKTDDHRVKVESRLCSHVRMAVQQNEKIGANNDAPMDDPIFRLVFLAKELADQAGKIDFRQFNEDYLPRMNSVPTLESSQDKMYGHLALTDRPTITSPSSDFLARKLQETEEECLVLKRTKNALGESLMEANNCRRDLEVTVKALTEELEEAKATNTSLAEELASAKEEVATLAEGNTKLEDELERTQNRLGDVSLQVSDLEMECASLREMVDEKDKEIDENMSLLKDQHQSILSVMDYTREIRRLMMELQEKLQPKKEGNSEGEEVENDPALAKKAWEDWLKETVPKMEAVESGLMICKMQLEVKVQTPEENDNESSETPKGRWSLFRFGRQ